LAAVSERGVSVSRVSAATLPSAGPAVPAHIRRSSKITISVKTAVMAAVTVALLVAASHILRSIRQQETLLLPPSTKHFEIAVRSLPYSEQSLRSAGLAISPDGSIIAYVASSNGTSQLYVRRMEDIEAEAIPETEGAKGPFFSPHGDWVGYLDLDDQALKRVSLILGGSPRIITRSGLGDSRGASWGPDDTIYFTPGMDTGVFKVSAEGGEPEPVTQLNRDAGEKSHRLPQLLPGGEALLFSIGTLDMGTWDDALIAVHSLRTGEQDILPPKGMNPRYVSTGHLVYGRAGALYAVPFDLNRLEVNGDPVMVRRGVITNEGFGSAQFAFSDEGTLVYHPGGSALYTGELVWMDRQGEIEKLGAPISGYLFPRISPDGNKIMVSILKANNELWMYDLERGMLEQRVSGGGDNVWSTWTPDSERVAFSSLRTGYTQMFWIPADGSSAEEQLLSGGSTQIPACFSPDGKLLIYIEDSPQTGLDIWALPLEGDRQPWAYLNTPDNEGAASLSPDGRWLAYASDRTGRPEIYVQSFPTPGRRIQISFNGGAIPVWASDGRELFYVEGNKLMSTSVTTDPDFISARPKFLFAHDELLSGINRNYDIAPDGNRFLTVQGVEQDPIERLNVVLNWFNELNQLVPPGS